MARVLVVSESAPEHGINISRALSRSARHEYRFQPSDFEHGTHLDLVNPDSYDVLLNLGYFIPIGGYLGHIKRTLGKPVINTWIGSDILQNMSVGRQNPAHVEIAKSFDLNVADAPHFITEIKHFFGIDAHEVITAPDFLPDVAPLPKKPVVGIYMPPHRLPFYNYELFKNLASLCQDIQFFVFGMELPLGDTGATSLANVSWIPFVRGDDKFALMKKCTAVLRIPLHDGVSIFSLEFLAMGRYLITGQPGFPDDVAAHAHTDDLIGMVAALDEITKKTEPNLAGAAWVRKNYSPERMVKSFDDAVDRVLRS